MNFPFYIAKRYLFAKKSHNVINVISGISVAGIALASFALICTLSVFNGFNDLVATLFTKFDPELKIVSTQGKLFNTDNSKIQDLSELPFVEEYSTVKNATIVDFDTETCEFVVDKEKTEIILKK